MTPRVARANQRLRVANVAAVEAAVRFYLTGVANTDATDTRAAVAENEAAENAIDEAGAAVVEARAALDKAKAATKRTGRVRK